MLLPFFFISRLGHFLLANCVLETYVYLDRNAPNPTIPEPSVCHLLVLAPKFKLRRKHLQGLERFDSLVKLGDSEYHGPGYRARHAALLQPLKYSTIVACFEIAGAMILVFEKNNKNNIKERICTQADNLENNTQATSGKPAPKCCPEHGHKVGHHADDSCWSGHAFRVGREGEMGMISLVNC